MGNVSRTLALLCAATFATFSGSASAQETGRPPAGAATAAQDPEQTQSNLDPQGGWPSPVNDRARYTLILPEVLELRPAGSDTDFRWDIEGWHGGDYNRLWFKSEGERDTAFKADYDLDVQLLYGRFFGKYYDFQLGGRIETQRSQGRNVTRVHAVVGVQALVPGRFEVEPSLFMSQDGDVSAAVSGSRDFRVTQRLVVQPRLETNFALQRVESFTVGRGLNNIEAGVRLRYEIHRKFGPYVGVSLDRSFFGTAELVRREGGETRQMRFVAGVRAWY